MATDYQTWLLGANKDSDWIKFQMSSFKLLKLIRACGFYHNFNGRGSLLTRELYWTNGS